MKIGIVCYPTYGGSGIVATELGMDLAEKGHEVHFFSTNVPARLNIKLPNIYFHRIHVETYPLFQYQPYDLALSTILYEKVLQYKLDLVHVHYAIPHAYAAYFTKQMLARKGYHLPIVTTLHGTDITLVGKHPVYKTAVEFSINESDVVTSVSESLKQDTLKAFEITNDIQVVHNFIDNDQYLPEKCICCRNNFAEPTEKVILHTSNLRKVKRIQDVISTFNIIQKTIPSKLIIAGEGPEWELADQLINEYGIQDKVKSLGMVSDLQDVLKAADLFILPSEQESFGLAALEAMAANVPVISSNAGGLPEVNIDGVTGFVCPVGDVEMMAEKAIHILENDQRLLQFSTNAKEQAIRFDKKNILPQYEDLYRKTLNLNK
ncbi:N-acetyl-alpha-D-glucosaminyl L-malate synthase BshA [Faecalibacter bovis]|uniref:N-acetyl-alpha-D-glucosaminyl L-malate synthase BshA n=1 Tax=Faecalibacter bovis TaxID=2898187 RepID=A0ABX7XGQ3_9FLAO|nr:N-acetyl-alpha-D-glucosaminyl L-malate synthase BshA [Faecalibacter bovis]MBS7333960.1 N-acetyl-alpha-D-glucosaminyl L-malate synthase BshA [Weeksellaceae bacterium]QTV07070.1 N-acetyl-alpha-D-glucosaminyl L-malate synthase BshA [Faecalibacter bovis]